MILFCPFYHTETLFDKLTPTIVSTIIVVAIFFTGRFFDMKIRKREVERNWYLKVIIEPNIDKVEIFFNKTYISIKKSVDILISSKSKCNFDEYIIIKSVQFGSFQELLREFKFDFINIVQSNSPQLTNEISSFLMKIEDTITEILDKEDLKIEDYTQIEKSIKEFKVELITLLHKPIGNPVGNKQ